LITIKNNLVAGHDMSANEQLTDYSSI
jgi:hypothetical protein